MERGINDEWESRQDRVSIQNIMHFTPSALGAGGTR